MIPAVVLAAGYSRRMGRSKAALPLPRGTTFLGALLHSLAEGGAAPLVVVTRGDPEAAAAASRVPISFDTVVNPDPARGQLSSMQCGLAALRPGVPAALVALVDVPLVRPATVAALIECWARTRAALVRPARVGRHGHPILVGSETMAALLEAPVGSTARDVLRPFLPGVDVPVDDDGPFEDVDTPEEYERLLCRLRQ